MGQMTVEQRKAIALASARLRLSEGNTTSAAEQIANDPITRAAQGEIDAAKNVTNVFGRAVSPETLAGNPITRFAVGAAEPIIGAAQLVDKATGGTGVGENYTQLSSMMDAGRAQRGDSGTDLPRLAGNVLSPVNLAISKRIPLATTLPKRAVQGATLGVAAAATNPVAGTDTWANRAENMAEGGGFGAVVSSALPPALNVAGKGIGALVDLFSGNFSTSKAAKILQSAAGKDLPAIKVALANAPDDLTATQAVAGVKNDVWNALGELAASKDPDSFFSRLSAKQKEDMVTAIRKVAVGANQSEVRDVARSAKKTLSSMTEPMRQAQLDAANIGVLDTDAIIAGIQKNVEAPSIAGNSIGQRVLNNVASAIDSWTKKSGGTIPAEALYAIRKNAVNSEIETLMGSADPKVKQKYATKLLSSVKPMIDDAIENAGGTGWRDYLKTFEQGMRGIEQQKMGGKALELLNTNPKRLVSLAGGNEPKMVEKVFGTEYDFQRAMGANAKPINAVAAAIERDLSIKEGAARGVGGLEGILKENISKFKLPNWINAKIAITNRGLDVLESNVNQATMSKVYSAMRSGKAASELLKSIPATERVKVINAIVMSRPNIAAQAGQMAGRDSTYMESQ